MTKLIIKQLKNRWIPFYFVLSMLVACRADLDSQSAESTQASVSESIPSTVHYQHINWAEIQPLLKLTIPENQRTKKEKELLLKQPHYIEIVLQNSEPYLPFIIKQLEENKLPIALALLPFIESNYNIKSVPKGRAAGLWQIMPATGRSLDLKQTNNYDARLDIVASTTAAISLLKTLNQQFNGDWLLTLAAYNSGGSTVRKAIKKNQQLNLPTDYWSLALPQETMRYIPKFLAILEIVKNNQDYNITLPEFTPHNQLRILQVKEKTSLGTVAQLLKIDAYELKKLNPAFLATTADKKTLIYVKNGDLKPAEKQAINKLVQFKKPIKITLATYHEGEIIESIQLTNKIYHTQQSHKKNK